MDYANLIVVGGPISVGKTTLVNFIGLPQVYELDENDKLQLLLLDILYNRKKRISAEIIEFYFLKIRIQKYENYAHLLQTHILDRSVLESLWFAKQTLDSKSFKHFEIFWKKEVDQLFKIYGKPKLYILLTMSWETFKERIFLRGREIEVKNFHQNENYFKNHVLDYEKSMINIFNEFDINYKIIKTDNLNERQVYEIASKYIKGVL